MWLWEFYDVISCTKCALTDFYTPRGLGRYTLWFFFFIFFTTCVDFFLVSLRVLWLYLCAVCVYTAIMRDSSIPPPPFWPIVFATRFARNNFVYAHAFTCTLHLVENRFSQCTREESIATITTTTTKRAHARE